MSLFLFNLQHPVTIKKKQKHRCIINSQISPPIELETKLFQVFWSHTSQESPNKYQGSVETIFTWECLLATKKNTHKRNDWEFWLQQNCIFLFSWNETCFLSFFLFYENEKLSLLFHLLFLFISSFNILLLSLIGHWCSK